MRYKTANYAILLLKRRIISILTTVASLFVLKKNLHVTDRDLSVYLNYIYIYSSSVSLNEISIKFSNEKLKMKQKISSATNYYSRWLPLTEVVALQSSRIVKNC